MKTLYLVDASNMFFRAFFAIPPLTNDRGMPTNALYGFLSMSMKLIRDVKPDYLVYCFDRKEPSFRVELYPHYKANRDEMPDDLKPQIPYLKKLTERLGVTQLEKEKYEADDVIGALTMLGVKNGVQVVIVSGDKDFAQLVRPGVSLYDTMKDVRTDTDGVLAKYGVRPNQFIDYLAMVGDSSDNVPGVRGIGPKGAQKLLSDFETLEGVYQNIEAIKGATQTKLKEGRETAFLSRQLCTIVTDIALPMGLDDLKLKPIEPEPMKELLRELGFSSFERKLFAEGGLTGGPAKEGAPSAPTEVKSADKKPKASKSTSPRSWSEEEWTVEDLRAKVAPYSEIWGMLSERGLYLGYDGKVLKVPASDQEIGAALFGKRLRWKGYDVKQVIKALNVDNALVVWDGALAAYVVRAEPIGDFKDVYTQYCAKTLPEICSCVDLILAHLELEEVLREKLISQEGVAVFESLELPLVPVLSALERVGVRVDGDELKTQSLSLNEDIRRLEKDIHQAAGETFNINSPKQLGHVLFEKLKLPASKKTKTGFSTDSDVLESLAPEHPIARLILEYRELSKLKSTYVDALPVLISPVDGRVHTRLNQAATSTGRLSSTHPNLQNIPIRTERGRLVRKAFVAEPGNSLISADYSQIELRILAHITSDPGLTDAFNQDLDIHAATAAEVFAIDVTQVSADQRRIAKAVNFGIAYGQGAYGLADTLGIPRSEATEIIQRYFKRFAGVKKYMETTVSEGIERGYVSTLFGRRRLCSGLRVVRSRFGRCGS